MPIVTQPNLVEQSDFLGGWSPDGDDATTAPDVLLDVLNLLPDRNTSSLVTREGFERICDAVTSDGDHWVHQLFHFRASKDDHFLIIITTDGTSDANNVKIYAADLTASGFTHARIDTAGVTWTNPLKQHWGIAIDKIWYGGSKGNSMYSWDPSSDTWNDDAATGNWRTWVSDTNDDVDTGTEYGKDHAFTGKEKVTIGGDVYQANKSIRFDEWEDDRHYGRTTKVSRKTTWESSSSYWKSFKCIQDHSSTTAAADPGTGASWEDYWEVIRLPKPFNADNETADEWDFIPTAAETSVAAWHGNRLFMRFDGQGDGSRLLYSARVKPDRGKDIPDTTWDPTDFAPSQGFDGGGGGWWPFNDGKTGGDIRALHSYNTYLLVFKRRQVWSLAGDDDTTWIAKPVAHGVGAMGPQAVTEVDGIVFFLSDDGLYATDGTSVQPVEGNNKVHDYIRERMDQVDLDDDFLPTLWNHNGFIWISLPVIGADDDEDFVTLVYDPQTKGFWKLDLPVLDAVNYREQGITHMAFCAPPSYTISGATGETHVYEYVGDTDDDGAGTPGSVDVAWRMRTAWLPFGVLREQRRVRRTWFVVTGSLGFRLRAYRDWVETTVGDVTRTPVVSTAAHIDGTWIPDSHAVSFLLSGTEAPARVHGYAVDTQPRRARYHV